MKVDAKQGGWMSEGMKKSCSKFNEKELRELQMEGRREGAVRLIRDAG
jgi:hypothetical protein